MGYDKPSNALFLPAEFSSLNCYVCLPETQPSPPVIAAASDLHASFPGAQIEVGETVQFSADAVGTPICRYGIVNLSDPNDVAWFGGRFTHYVDFGNGYGTFGTWDFDRQFSRVYSSPGTYSVRDYVTCGHPCSWEILVVQLEEEVDVCSNSEFESTRARFTGPRPSNIQSRYGFQDQGNVFRFAMQPWSDTITQSSVAAAFAVWNNVIDTQSCGDYDIDADMTWGSATSHDVVFEVVTELPGSCGNFDPQGAAGLDLIEIPQTLGGTCGPVSEILGHEIGHAIGFGNAANTNATDIMNSPRQGPGTAKDYHAQTLLFYY